MPTGKRSSSALSRRLSPRAGGSGRVSQFGCSPTFSGVSGAASGSATTSGALDVSGAGEVTFSLSSRADSCRASSLKALFSTGVSTGNFASPIGRNGTTFLSISLGVSTGGSKSVGGEVSKAIGAEGSGVSAVTSGIAGGSAAGNSRIGKSWMGKSWIGGCWGAVRVQTSLVQAPLVQARLVQGSVVQASLPQARTHLRPVPPGQANL